MTKLDNDKLIQLNKIKWDSWAENDVLENCRVSFFNIKFKFDFTKYQKTVVDLIDFKEVSSFLDIGCGTGWAVGYAFKRADGKGEFYGLDLSEKMIEKAILNGNGNSHLHFLSGNAAELKFESDFFDAIMSTNAFHHFPEPDKVLSEIRRVLKPGGKVYILDPTADTPISKMINVLGRIVEKEHINMYSTLQFRKMYADAGLEYLYRFKKGVIKPVKVHIGEKKPSLTPPY